jgi:hypothetical protein
LGWGRPQIQGRARALSWAEQVTGKHRKTGPPNVYIQCLHIANARVRSGRDDLADYHEALAQLDALEIVRTAKWETVLLLGNPKLSLPAGGGTAASGKWSSLPVEYVLNLMRTAIF